MARFWGSSTVTSAPAAPATASASNASSNATATASATAKQGSRLVRQTDDNNTDNGGGGGEKTTYTNYLPQPPRTPEQKANRPLRPRSASRDAANSAGAGGNNNSNSNHNSFNNYNNNNSFNNNNNSFHNSGGSNLFAGEYSNTGTASAGGTGTGTSTSAGTGEDTYDWPEQIQFYAQQGGQGGGGGGGGEGQDSNLQQPNTQMQQPPRRSRMNSRDIPRSYSGLYGFSDGDLLPFELNRHRDTFGTETNTAWFLGVYLTLLTTVQLLSLTIMSDMRSTWTVTNAIHLMITLTYVHWLKGSLYDEQGEMNALTVWEQLEATQGTKPVRQVLLIVPTVLTSS
jgi:hypothetical protein